MKGGKCNGCNSTEIHSHTSSYGCAVKPQYADMRLSRMCRIKRLELDAKAATRRGKDVDVDHPIMAEYRMILREHWQEA